MPEMQVYPVVTTSGRRGRVFRKARFLDRSDTNRIEFDDGAELNVPPSALAVQSDGSFVLDDARPTARAEAAPAVLEDTPPAAASVPQPPAPMAEPPPEPAAAAEQTEPAALEPAEEQVIQTMAENTTQPLTFTDPLFTENAHVETVPINRVIDSPAQVRQEGDVTIIPVVEEVITITRRLLLREEIRITRRRTEVREPRRLVLNGNHVRTLGADGREVEVSE